MKKSFYLLLLIAGYLIGNMLSSCATEKNYKAHYYLNAVKVYYEKRK